VVTGTAITRLRKVISEADCSDVLGEVASWVVINGRVESGTISFTLGNTGTLRFSGTLTATRMTGTAFVRESTTFAETGSFAVNRQ
jgi:ribosomal protein L35AE/L33A